MGVKMRERSCRVLAMAMVLLCELSAATLALGQPSATLKGTVTDNTGAAMPGATIVVFNGATALQREAVTNREGSFIVSPLPAGAYSVRAVVSGFAPYEAEQIHLEAGEETTLAIRMQVAPLSEQVTVRPEVLVFGSTSLNADIRRTEDDPQPYVVFDRDQIDRSMTGNVAEFLKTRLPMNTSQGLLTQSTGGGNRSEINLRGLGTNQTLVMVDGRRLPSINLGSQGFQQPDLNGLPWAAVERIEVLPTTASGIYGGGATGGVINIITRKDYSSVDVRATYGNTFRTDAGGLGVDGSGGFSLEKGRTHILVSASRTDTDPLRGGDRGFAALGRARQFANNPAAFFALATPPAGYTSNIKSSTGDNLVLKNGTTLGSPFTFIPVGYRGTASDNGAALVANAGRYNLDLPDTVLGAGQGLYFGSTVGSAALSVRRRMADALDVFGDVSWFDNRGRSRYAAGLPSSVTLDASAPNNPFTTPIVVSFPPTGLSFPIEVNSKAVRIAAGAILRLPHDWTASADYQRSHSSYLSRQTFPVTGDPDGASGPGIADTAALKGGLLDVMRDLNAYPLDWSPYLLGSPNRFYGPASTFLDDATARVSGPVLHLPGGPVTVSGLVERRKERVPDVFADQVDTNNVPAISFYPARSQTALSESLEVRAAAVSDKNGRPLLHGLELQASVRHDGYDTRSATQLTTTIPSHQGPFPPITPSTNRLSATDYTLGVRYLPMKDVAVRGSVGTGFLPPSIIDVAPGSSAPSNGVTLVDPRRGGIPTFVGPFLTYRGGNPNLKAEDSTSWSAGTIVTPRVLPGLRLSVDYTRIDKTNEIGTLSQQDALGLEDALPSGSIVRDPLLPADAAKGYTAGAITAFNLPPFNLATTHLEAWDMQADYAWRHARLGELHVFTIATWQPHFRRQALPTSLTIEYAGYNDGLLQLPKWRGNAGLSWDRGPWGAAWSTQFYDRYFAYGATIASSSVAQIVLNQGSPWIPSQTYHDLFMRYRLGHGTTRRHDPLGGAEVAAGIQNVFDTRPPVIATTGATGGYSTYGDPRLRRFSLTLRTTF